MRSPAFTVQYQNVMRQSTRNQVPITMQRTFTHIIPPISTQITISNTLDQLLSKVDELEKNYVRKLYELQELKQSILQKAFTGEITADFIQ